MMSISAKGRETVSTTTPPRPPIHNIPALPASDPLSPFIFRVLPVLSRNTTLEGARAPRKVEGEGPDLVSHVTTSPVLGTREQEW